MKNKETETKFKAALGVTGHLFSRAVCLGAVILICSSAPAQNLFMSDGHSGIAHNLGHIYKIPPDGVPSSFASGLDGPLGLAFDRAGNLFVASFSGSSGNVYKFTPAGARSTFASGLDDPEGLAFDSAGNLFVSDTGNIYKFTPGGVRSTFASGLNQAVGLAFDSAGNLFVADFLAGNIYKFSPVGARTTFASGLSSPFDLAFDSAGNLFVTDWGNGSGGKICKFTPKGVRSTFAELGAPEGLAFDSAGNLFVVDEDTGNIFKFTPNGVRSTFAKEVGLSLDEVAFLAFQPATLQPAQLLNISTRMEVKTGDQVLIAGFIITGNDPKKVILRAIGPSLAGPDIANPLANPVLELHGSKGGLITSNDNWKDTQQSAIEASGVPPQNDLESAIVATLDPGNYTAVMSGRNNGTGVGLVEGYDLDQVADSQLANISARGFVETESNVMIGGFILGGQKGSANVLIRALGPSLAGASVSGALADPTLELHDENGALVQSNDNWKDTQQTAIEATGIPPSKDLESALVATLKAGAYTAIVAGKDATTGVGLVEIYRLP